ncbi:cytochrome P450 2C20-like isoform X3 [Erpetoichthys calabaricus]|uniref:cytochrome P450 2C20-like isoform X3 n=1 Tax=Erpetoichthys calabaricus TaxID=27687 RepID=UPI002234BD38|nr:cytochrome P450 2C20-like isoform X3 [Erpetoichthys calabaricus]
MELFGTLVLASIVLGLLFLIFGRDSSRYSKMPPGPTPLPFIGNMLQLDSRALYESFMKLKETYGPVMTVHLGPMRVVVLIGFDAVHEALVQQPDEFAGRAVSPLIMKLTGDFGLIQSNGERWKQIRRFSLSTLRDFGMGKRSIEEWIQEEAKHLTEEFRKTNGSPCDPTIFLSRAVSNVICSIVFGQRFDYQDKNFIELLSLLDANLRLLASPARMLYSMFPVLIKLIPGPFNKMLKNVNEIKRFTSNMISQHKETLVSDSPRDFIDSFLIKMKQESDNPATEFHFDNLNMTVFNLFTAGTETTSTTLRYGLLILMKYPHIQEKVQKEIDAVIGRDCAPAMEDRRKMPYTDAVLHEVQRFIDLVPLNAFHETTKDTVFRGYTIPGGTVVSPVLHSVLFDKTKWATPYTFNPGHFLDENGCFKMNPAFMPFSAGKRVCAGEGLAKMELFLFFSTLLQNFSFQPTEEPDKISLTPNSKSFFKLPVPYTFFAIPR